LRFSAYRKPVICKEDKMTTKEKAICVTSVLTSLLAVPPTAKAAEFTVGTLAYSYAAQGHPNVYIQGSLSDRSAWFFDKCEADGNTIAALYKHYRNQVSRGPYWFGGMSYIANGKRAGYSAVAGLGYEYTTRSSFTFGAFAGGAAGGDNDVTYPVGNITVGYRFH
jgi:hypothetical protein